MFHIKAALIFAVLKVFKNGFQKTSGKSGDSPTNCAFIRTLK